MGIPERPQQDESPVEVEEEAEPTRSDEAKVPPVAFHEACVQRIQDRLGVSLVRRSRAGYSTPDRTVALNCAVSKEYNPDTHPNYWCAFHPHQQEFLRQHPKAYVALGCGVSTRLIVIPYADFAPWLHVTPEAVEVLAIVTKVEATHWLAEHGTPDAPSGAG